MGHDAPCCVATHGAIPAFKGEAETATDAYSCLTLPSCLESFSPSSEPSTSASSTSEIFTSAGLVNEASTLFDRSSGGDLTPTFSTISNQAQPLSSKLDCGGLSSALNIPPPIEEEDPGLNMPDLDDDDRVSEDVNLDIKACVDEMSFSDACCGTDSGCDDDMFLSRLDEMLQSDIPQEFASESSLASMDDLFPDLSAGQESCALDEISAWSGADTLKGLDSLSFSNVGAVQAVSSSDLGGEEETASQMFAHWLQSNAHWISLSDLRKIKLKTSTIENVTKRLGGGKKGLMLFLKFVLMWIQNSRNNFVAQKGAAMVSPPVLHSSVSPSSRFSGTTASSRFSGTTAMNVVGPSRREVLGAVECPGVLPTATASMQTFSGCGSSPTAPMSNDWTVPLAQDTRTSTMHRNLNLAIPVSRSYGSFTKGGTCSPLSSSNFCQSSNPWLRQTNSIVQGLSPASMSPLPSLARGSNIREAYGPDVSSMMLALQQPHSADTTPAATTRAARKSRMERQRWSIRRSRRWAAASQHHRLSAVSPSSGGAHSSLSPWSQSLRNTAHKSLYVSSQPCQQNSNCATTMEYQQNKRPEKSLKLLFHKELKQSDVGSLGRIVLPKKAAETCLPPLELRDGVNLIVEDIDSSKVWNMRYRFWPNNKSRMYLLENTSDFVKLYDLKEGDCMMMYLDNMSNRYVIRGVKGSGMPAAALAGSKEVHVGEKRKRSLSKEEMNLVSRRDSCDESLLMELIEQSLEDLKESQGEGLVTNLP